MFNTNNYDFRFIRVNDSVTGAKTTTICLVKPDNMYIGWARAGVAYFSPNREIVKEIDTDKSRKVSEIIGETKVIKRQYVDKFDKSVGRVVSLKKALINMGFLDFEIHFIMIDYIEDNPLPKGPQWMWLYDWIYKFKDL